MRLQREKQKSNIDSYHSLCLGKRDIILSELDACRKLLRYAVDETEKKTIETEILELQLAIDLMY
jgi:hypothetical protein